MASSTLRRAESRYILRLLGLAAFILAAGGASSEAGYLYQTRHTQHSPGVPRKSHVAVALGDGRVGLFAGEARSDVQLFDPATEEFTTSRATEWFANFAGVALPDGNALLVDGEHDCVFGFLEDRYIPAANTYSGGFIRFPVLVPLSDGRIFICGGKTENEEYQKTCGLFDPRTFQFSSLRGLAIPRCYHTAVLLDEDRVLVIGGMAGDMQSPSEEMNLDTLELYDVRRGASVLVRTKLREGRYEHCSVRLPDGRVLVLGGVHWFDDLFIPSTEIFDPATGTMVDGPMLGLGRRGPRIAVMPSGRIAVFGGQPDARAIEVYCPGTGTFELAPCLMLDPRYNDFTATSLDSGAVLIVGGTVTGGDENVTDAEIFEEVATETSSAPPMTLASIQGLLTDRNPNVVNETAEWLVGLGPQVKPILETLAQDETPELQRQAVNVLQLIDAGSYPEVWCVEVWDAFDRLDTVWLDGLECPDSYEPGTPPEHFTAILRATEGVDFTHLVVRFPAHASYEDRVKLFNLVGWTRIPNVVLGENLSADELARVIAPATK